jgi:hypothetical protein
MPNLTGDVTTAEGAVATTISNNAVTLAKLADIATQTILGRTTASTGDPEALTATQATALLDNVTSSAKGLAPASGGGTSNFLRADATWAAPAGAFGPSSGHKTSDQNFSSSTLADVTGLSFSVTANHYYEFRFLVLFRSPTSTVGISLGVTCPASPTRFGYTARILLAGDGAGGELQGPGISSGDAVISTAVAATNTDYIAEVVGILIPSTNGTVQLQAGNETGATTIVIRQGSLGYLWDHGT